MNRILRLAAVLLWVGAALANPEVTVDLPGGATMDFVWIEPGTFIMGSPDSDNVAYGSEMPQHEVTLTQGFWLAKYEMTVGQRRAVLGPSWYEDIDPDDLPESFFWPNRHDAPNVERLLGVLNGSQDEPQYRLPTEAEWEYACRAGTTTRWFFGDGSGQLSRYAWYSASYPSWAWPRPMPVGMKEPNPWGLHDMYGNMSEWVADWYGPYTSEAQTDPTGPAFSVGNVHVLRGGGWGDGDRRTRSAYRYGITMEWFYAIRLVRMAPAPTAGEFRTWGQVKTEGR